MRTPLRSTFFALLLLLGVSEGLRLWWFTRLPGNEDSDVTLSWEVPEGAIARNLSETRGGKALGYDQGTQVLLGVNQSLARTEVTYLQYEQGNNKVLSDLYLHSPEVCLPASGVPLVAELPSRTFEIEGRDLLVRHWLFKHPISGVPLYAFKVIWSSDEHLIRQALYKGEFKRARIRAALARREFAAARMILTVSSGIYSEQDSWANFEDKVISHLFADESLSRK